MLKFYAYLWIAFNIFFLMSAIGVSLAKYFPSFIPDSYSWVFKIDILPVVWIFLFTNMPIIFCCLKKK